MLTWRRHCISTADDLVQKLLNFLLDCILKLCYINNVQGRRTSTERKKQMTTQEVVVGLCLKHKGNRYYMLNALHEHEDEKIDLDQFTTNQKFITIIDDEYPENLKQGKEPPIVLFYEGDISLLKKDNKVAIVSSKSSNSAIVDKVLDVYNEKTIYVLKGETDVDKYIIKNYKNPLIIVWPTTLSQFPLNLKEKVLKNGGLIITPLPDNAKDDISDGDFTYNDVTIGNLCDKMVVMRVSSTSRALISVNVALSLNRELFVVPTEVGDNSANNQLIFDGAVPIVDEETLYCHLNN